VPGVVPKSDPCQMITSLVLVGLALGVEGEGSGLGNQIAISTRGVIICRGLKMGTTAPGPILGFMSHVSCPCLMTWTGTCLGA